MMQFFCLCVNEKNRILPSGKGLVYPYKKSLFSKSRKSADFVKFDSLITLEIDFNIQ